MIVQALSKNKTLQDKTIKDKTIKGENIKDETAKKICEDAKAFSPLSLTILLFESIPF